MIIALGLMACGNVAETAGDDGVGSATDAPSTEVVQRLAVPLYIHPFDATDGNAWNRVIAAGSAISYVVALVANPGDVGGPGMMVEPAYTDALSRAQQAGQRVLGYVDTSYGMRALATVQNEIDSWYRFYPNIDGVFLDQTPSSGDLIANYYSLASSRIRSMAGNHVVVINPGQPQIDEGYMSLADIVMSYESPYNSPINGYAPGVYMPPPWMVNYSPLRFWHAVREITSVDEMKNILDLARSRGAGHVFVSNYPDPPAYSRIPTFFDAEVTAIRR